MMSVPRVAWVTAAVALGGCTTLLGVDDDYQLMGSSSTQGGGGASSTTSTGTSGTGGSSSTGTTATGTSGTGGSSSTGTTGTSGSSTGTGTTPCDPMYTCAEAIYGDPTKLCNGPSGNLYDTYYGCVCGIGGACFAKCSDNACMNGASTAECTMCLQDATKGCSKEFNACANDI